MQKVCQKKEEKLMNLFYKEIPSEVGKLKLVANEQALVAILWENQKPNRIKLGDRLENEHHPIIAKTEKQLREYFSKKRRSFDIPMELHGTDFQKAVWEELKKIPFGSTLSYGQIAKNMNHPKAVRAIGGAIGKNPISIIIPCHRVIGSDGSLTGFAGGLGLKAALLKLET